MSDFKDACILHVARELTRGKASANPYIWDELMFEKRDDASSKINLMTNIELLELIGEVLEIRIQNDGRI